VDQQHKKVGDIEDMIEKYKSVVPTGTEAKIRGFMRYPRKKHALRPTKERVGDFGEIFVAHADADGPAHEEEKKTQAARCMDCGVPFCQSETGTLHPHRPLSLSLSMCVCVSLLMGNSTGYA
jgi:hypothetical protein